MDKADFSRCKRLLLAPLVILDRVSTAGRSLLPRQAGFLKNNASSRYKTLRDY